MDIKESNMDVGTACFKTNTALSYLCECLPCVLSISTWYDTDSYSYYIILHINGNINKIKKYMSEVFGLEDALVKHFESARDQIIYQGLDIDDLEEIQTLCRIIKG